MAIQPQSGRCPKCSAGMELGFLRDRSHGADLPVEWIGGAPEFSRFLRLIKVRGKVRYRVEVFRCTQCGYLEQYAREKLQKDKDFFGRDWI